MSEILPHFDLSDFDPEKDQLTPYLRRRRRELGLGAHVTVFFPPQLLKFIEQHANNYHGKKDFGNFRPREPRAVGVSESFYFVPLDASEIPA